MTQWKMGEPLPLVEVGVRRLDPDVWGDLGDGFAATCPSSLRSPEPVPVSALPGDGQAQGRGR